MNDPFLTFTHSLLRYGLLLVVAVAGGLHLRGWILQRPILTYERMLAILAVILAHTQLAVGLILYAINFKTFNRMGGDIGRYWKMEHIGTMIVAVALITIGRIASKRAKDELVKQKRIAIYYLIALALMLWAVPWPFTQMGHGRGWI